MKQLHFCNMKYAYGVYRNCEWSDVMFSSVTCVQTFLSWGRVIPHGVHLLWDLVILYKMFGGDNYVSGYFIICLLQDE